MRVLDEVVRLLLGELATASTELPPGGTPDTVSDAAESAYLNELTDLMVAFTGMPHGEERQELLQLLRGQLGQLRQMGRQVGVSVPTLLRQVAGINSGACDLADVARGLFSALHVGSFHRLVEVIDQLVAVGRDGMQALRSTDPDDQAAQQQDLQALLAAAIVVPPPIQNEARLFNRSLRGLPDRVLKTGVDGDIAHACITLHYALDHRADALVLGSHAIHGNVSRLVTRTPGPATPPTLKDATSTVFALAKTALLGPTKLREPDILNLTTREVYEIKPMGKAIAGLVQCYGRYLLPLNIALLGQTLAAAVLQSQTGTGGPTISTPDTPFLPGYKWRPSAFYVIPPDRLVIAGRPVPGLILYEILDAGRVENRASVPNFFELMEDAAKRNVEVVATVAVAIVAALVTVACILSGCFVAPVPAGVTPSTIPGVMPVIGNDPNFGRMT